MGPNRPTRKTTGLKKRSLSEKKRSASPKKKKSKRNKGMDYEKLIDETLYRKKLRVLDKGLCDTGFIHRGKNYLVEVKAKNAPDFGQKYLEWNDQSGWEWSKPDEITDVYDQMGVIKKIDNGFTPNLYTVTPRHSITLLQKKADQRAFELSNIEIRGLNLLYRYYARRNCYYIQIEGKGFYYLERDEAGLGIPQFRPVLKLRLRAKTVSSIPVYNYRFLAVINADKRSVPLSDFDLEDKGIRKFPNIVKEPIKKTYK